MARFVYSILKNLTLISLVLSASVPSYAQMSCDRVHRGLSPYSIEMRVDRTTLKEEQDRESALSHLATGGGFEINERSLSPKETAAVMELVRMIAATRAVSFSYKEFKDHGKLILGIPLRNRYSLEITYKSDYRDNQRVFVADQVVLITPSGHADIAQKNVQNIEGGLVEKLNIDLSDYPGLRDNNFLIHIPAEISGKTLQIFEHKIAKRLSLLTKDELVKVSAYKNYWSMRTSLWSKSVMAKIREYHIKGVFKTYVKYLAVPVLAVATIWTGNTYFPVQTHQARLAITHTVKDVLNGPQNPWLKASLDQFAMAEHLPLAVKNQIRDLQADFDKNSKAPEVTAALNKQFSPTINSSNKFQLNKDQFMWISTEFDKAKNKDVTLLFITQDNKYGQIEYAVAEIDRQKYEPLIKFLESKGQFLPLQEVTK